MTLGAYVALTSRSGFWCIQLLNQLNAGLVYATTQMPSPLPSFHEAVHQRTCWQVHGSQNPRFLADLKASGQAACWDRQVY
jgi:hypothetical protein